MDSSGRQGTRILKKGELEALNIRTGSLTRGRLDVKSGDKKP